jgi:hypothetical protein
LSALRRRAAGNAGRLTGMRHFLPVWFRVSK